MKIASISSDKRVKRQRRMNKGAKAVSIAFPFWYPWTRLILDQPSVSSTKRPRRLCLVSIQSTGCLRWQEFFGSQLRNYQAVYRIVLCPPFPDNVFTYGYTYTRGERGQATSSSRWLGTRRTDARRPPSHTDLSLTTGCCYGIPFSTVTTNFTL